MPAKNTLKENVADSYYHVYARGNNKQTIFLEHADFTYFKYLLERHLSTKVFVNSKNGRLYPSYSKDLELLSFCLMGNHFHLLVYQVNSGAMSSFMRSLMTGYSKYFNLKYRRSGSLFESRYKASRISNQEYLEHISRYIHLNPRYWKRYPYSSFPYYLKKPHPEWVNPEKILELFPDPKKYIDFLSDYEGHKQMLDEIKHNLANK